MRRGIPITHLRRPNPSPSIAILADKLDTILSEAQADNFHFYGLAPQGTSLEKVLGVFMVAMDRAAEAQELLTSSPDLWCLRNEQVQLLLRLHGILSEDDKALIVSMMLDRILAHSQHSAFLVVALARLGHQREGFAKLMSSVSDLPDETNYRALLAFSDFVKYDNTRLNDEDLEFVLQNKSEGESGKLPVTLLGSEAHREVKELRRSEIEVALSRLRKQLKRLKYERLKGVLIESGNFEVNQDKQTLVIELGRFSFSAELVKSLELAEAEYRKATSSFEFKACVAHNRGFLETLLVEVGRKVLAIRSKSVSVRWQSAGSVRDFLKNEGFLSDRMHKLCEALYQFASDEGVHALSSGKETARIARNMNIELGLLLLRRYDDYAPKANVAALPVPQQLGTAIDAQFHFTGNPKIDWNVYSGRHFIMGPLDSEPYDVYETNYELLADLLANNLILGWVNGKYEIGPRALGNRSILAAPFHDNTRVRLNEIKRREQFRPIAPVCLEEDAAQCFGCDQTSPFMLYTHHARTDALAAVTHVNGTARLQTVSSENNRSLYELLVAFKARTGYGVLCNTSLNFNGKGFINKMKDLSAYAMKFQPMNLPFDVSVAPRQLHGSQDRGLIPLKVSSEARQWSCLSRFQPLSPSVSVASLNHLE